MNTIRIEGERIVEKNLDSSIDLSFPPKKESLSINTIKLCIKEDTALCISYTGQEKSKLEFVIEVLENVHFHLKETKEGKKRKVEYTYYLGKCSDVFVSKAHHIEAIKEKVKIYLEEDAHIKYKTVSLAEGEEDYKITAFHNAPRSFCNLSLKAVSIEEGEVSFKVTNVVEKGKKDCEVHQNSRIITLNHHKQEIQPILLIDENEVDASHSAHIGTFDEDTLFYLQSRGIEEKEALRLLLTGFLLGEEGNKKMKNWIDMYWR